MIFTIRGCSGAGKSTAARIVYTAYPKHKVLVSKNKVNYLTLGYGHDSLPDMAFIGHYTTDDPYKITPGTAQGTDAFNTREQLIHCIDTLVAHNYNILYEHYTYTTTTLLQQWADSKLDVVCINLNTPPATIILRRIARASARGTTVEKEFGGSYTHSAFEKQSEKMRAVAGIVFEEADSSKALEVVKRHIEHKQVVELDDDALFDLRCKIVASKPKKRNLAETTFTDLFDEE